MCGRCHCWVLKPLLPPLPISLDICEDYPRVPRWASDKHEELVRVCLLITLRRNRCRARPFPTFFLIQPRRLRRFLYLSETSSAGPCRSLECRNHLQDCHSISAPRSLGRQLAAFGHIQQSKSGRWLLVLCETFPFPLVPSC